jgi:hypothetical protein
VVAHVAVAAGAGPLVRLEVAVDDVAEVGEGRALGGGVLDASGVDVVETVTSRRMRSAAAFEVVFAGSRTSLPLT